MATRLTVLTAALALSCAALAGCGSSDASEGADRVPVGTVTTMPSEPTPEATEGTTDTATDEPSSGHAHGGSSKPQPLRAGEKRMTLEMPAAYTPSAPTGTGTDDYRCSCSTRT